MEGHSAVEGHGDAYGTCDDKGHEDAVGHVMTRDTRMRWDMVMRRGTVKAALFDTVVSKGTGMVAAGTRSRRPS